MDSSTSRRRKDRVFTVLVWALTLGLAAPVAEILARALRPDLVPKTVLQRLIRERDTNPTHPDADFHHVGEGAYGVSLLNDPSGEPKNILIVGDSFAWGSAASPGQRFADLVGRRLGSTAPVQVAAIPSTSPIVYRNLVQKALALARYRAVAIFVDQTDPADDFEYERDLVNEYGSRRFDVARLERRASDAYRAYTDEIEFLNSWRSSFRRLAVVGIFSPPGLENFFPRDNPQYFDVQLAMSRRPSIWEFNSRPNTVAATTMERLLYRNLDEAVSLAREHGASVILTANPWEFQVSPLSPGGMALVPPPYPKPNRLESVLQTRYRNIPGVTILPMTAAFRGVPDPSSLFAHAPPGEIHWSNEGHALAAKVLLETLASTGIAPVQAARGR